jgi:hypothetical protein
MFSVNNQKGEAVIGTDGKRGYYFRFNYDFVADLEERTGLGAFAVYDHFSAGTHTVEMLRDVIACALHKVGGKEVEDEDRVEEAQNFLELEGLEESYAAAIQFLSVAMIGDRKKQLAKRIATLEEIAELLKLSPSLNYKKPLFATVVRLATFGLLICTAYRVFVGLG